MGEQATASRKGSFDIHTRRALHRHKSNTLNNETRDAQALHAPRVVDASSLLKVPRGHGVSPPMVGQ